MSTNHAAKAFDQNRDPNADKPDKNKNCTKENFPRAGAAFTVSGWCI